MHRAAAIRSDGFDDAVSIVLPVVNEVASPLVSLLLPSIDVAPMKSARRILRRDPDIPGQSYFLHLGSLSIIQEALLSIVPLNDPSRRSRSKIRLEERGGGDKRYRCIDRREGTT